MYICMYVCVIMSVRQTGTDTERERETGRFKER